MFLSAEQLKQTEARFEALQEARSDLKFNSPLKDTSSDETFSISPDLSDQAGNRRMTLEYKAPEPTDFAYERAIGKNDSVYSNFAELILEAKQKVGRILVKKNGILVGYATGFMVSPRLMLTNWHVFQTQSDAATSEVQFGYEFDILGMEKSSTAFAFRPDDFFHSNEKLDYALVAVNAISRDSLTQLSTYSYLYLDPEKGKLGEVGKESLNIIHHPDGDFKQLSIRENLFIEITPNTIWYKTDTAQGSSGSPVFNDQWQVVALHHSGVPSKNDKGEYIDKNGDPVPYLGGKIQESRINWIANEGIRISVILDDIFTQHGTNELIAQLKIKNNTARTSTPVIKNPEVIDSSNFAYPKSTSITNGDIKISLPANLLGTDGNFSLNLIRNGSVINIPNQNAPYDPERISFFELKKLEQTMDYSLCQGYLSDFLGTDIPMPEPTSALKKYIALANNGNSSELKYHHYSVRQHSLRRMPAISAINIDGNPKVRLDDFDRKDNWLRDNRLDFNIQLDDNFYRNSGFDRGHMSRREDADWGDTALIAKRNADLTCMYTNACPQVASLNQSSKKGLWGKLELTILESGAIKEGPLTNKISVLNGPIFRENDPLFKGVQIPMDFYKIVIWPTKKGEIKATAFVLSQEKLIKDIKFEQLDIHLNKEFKLYQYSIKKLSEETGLNFSQIIALDTFKAKAIYNELTSEQEIAALIKQI